MGDQILSGKRIDTATAQQARQQQPDFGAYEYPRCRSVEQVYDQVPDQVLNKLPNNLYNPRRLADCERRYPEHFNRPYQVVQHAYYPYRQEDYGYYGYSRNSKDSHCSWLEAWGAKAAYLGSLGRLVPTKDALKAELLKAGDIGEQLVKKMNLMEKQGWAIGNAFLYFPEPKAGWAQVLADSNENRKIGSASAKIAVSLATLGSLLPGASMADTWKFVRLHGNNAMIWSLGLGSVHGQDPIKLMAPFLGHEISHNDGIPKALTPTKINSLNREERLSYAKRLMLTEARAHLVESAIYERLKTKSYGVCDLKQLVKEGKLGSHIWNRYNRTDIYKALDMITPGEADDLVSDYFSRHFGELIDPKTGTYRKIDINAGLDEQIGHTQFDDQLMEKMKKVDYTHVPSALSGMRKIAVRGGQALLGGAALIATADLVHGFSKGADVGLSKVARSYSSLAGYEVGSALVGSVFKKNILANAGSALLGGVVGSWITDESVGSKVEQKSKDIVRSLGKQLNIALLAPEEATRST